MRLRAGFLVLFCSWLAGCTIGPRALENHRLRYNEAVKRTSEEQLLLNIVRLRYTDTPSSISVTSIATQHEFVKSLKMGQFFTDGVFTSLLPLVELTGVDRPTIALTPQDDQDFTKRLFTPIPLEGVVYLSKTTWPISTVFRLWVEHLNWVSNAEAGSGPTPKTAPIYREFLEGIQALQRLEDRKVVHFSSEETEVKISEGLASPKLSGTDVLEAAKAGFEFRRDEKKDVWTLIKKRQSPHLYIDAKHLQDSDLKIFCQAFKLKPGLTRYDLVAGKSYPYLADAPKEGLTYLDLESRSLLQVLFFLSHAVQVPHEHARTGQAPMTLEHDGCVFDWRSVHDGFFQVSHTKCRQRPKNAHVAIQYEGYWFYIDTRDRDTKATFALVMELARLELAGKSAEAGPILTLPIGGR